MRWYLLAASALAAGLAVRRRFAVVTVTGDSMMPALLPGDRVLVRRTRIGRLHPGQVVVAEMPGKDGGWTTPARGPASRREWMIKRLAAGPGDPRPTDSLPPTADPAGRLVPPGKFVVLGDNPDWSHDSRHLGYIPGERLFGVVVRRTHAEDPCRRPQVRGHLSSTRIAW
jgi:signal peptidase I